MGAMMEVTEAIFDSVGQAVHVAFVVMAHEPMQDGPLRKALIRVMESARLGGKAQRAWLEQLRGEPSPTIRFGGLTSAEVRAQCAMITEAVKSLPKPEMWALQAKYGFTEFDDLGGDDAGVQQLVAAAAEAARRVESATKRLALAHIELATAREMYAECRQRITTPDVEESRKLRYQAACDDVRDISAERFRSESSERTAKIALERLGAPRQICNGPVAGAAASRRFVFSPERIAAIQGLSDWFKPQFSRIKPLALDFLLGRMYGKHSQVEINFRVLADNFGGSHGRYFRAHHKLKNRVRELEAVALRRLEPRLVEHGVALPTESS